jgi:hypothetical protein|eukprot:COSAG02_NODE_12202_length_1581_cov_1.232794_2_plen_204_part_00
MVAALSASILAGLSGTVALSSSTAGVYSEMSSSSQRWWVDPITVKVMHDRRTPFDSSVQTIDVAGMRGECERRQVWTWNDDIDLTDIMVAFTDLEHLSSSERGRTTAPVFPKEQWSYKQQGYVNASTSTRYNCIEDILTHHGGPYPPVPTPPLPGTDCDKTPFGHCWTGWYVFSPSPQVSFCYRQPVTCSETSIRVLSLAAQP